MKYLKVFTDFLEVAEGLSDGALARLFRAMLRYALDGTEPQMKSSERALWTVARQNIDRETAAYESKVKHLQRGRSSVSKTTRSVSEEDKDKEKEKDKDKDKDKDIYIGGEPPAPPAPKAHIYIQPPSLEEVESYCRERKNRVNPQYFYDYYQSNGWRVGKNPMKDWKAAVRSWESNGMDRERPARENELSDADRFRAAIELHRMKEAKQV